MSRSIHSLPLKRTVISGNLEFHFVEDGSGSPLVLLHGVLGDWRNWEGLWPAFTNDFRTIAYSRRFNWPNQNPPDSPNHSALIEAEDLAELLEEWAAHPAILVGSSYGAYTALALSVQRPDLVRAMVLTEPPMLSWANLTEEGKKIRNEFEKKIRQPSVEAFQRGRNEEAVRLLTGGIVGASVMQNLPKELMLRRHQNMQSIRMLTLSTNEFPFLSPESVANIRVPTLLLAGEKTPAIHDCVFKSLCDAMPQATSARIANAGHAVDRDNPQAFLKEVHDFFQRHQFLSR
jgi:esterase